jgi:hypothetical protein
MTNHLVLDDPWPRITAACKKSRGDVAVAYVGQGAGRLLPLRTSSRLVVDASEGAVRSGQTDPRELLKYFRKGVEVFSQPRLHAKVFAFANVAFVGSTNVSGRSADYLVEAAVSLTTRPSVAQARGFVQDVAKSPMGEQFLKRLVKIYRPPRVGGGKRRRQQRVPTQERLAEGAPLNLIRLVPMEWGPAEWQADEAGIQEARKLKRRGFKLDSFSWRKLKLPSMDEQVLMLTTYSSRNAVLAPPGRLLAARKVRGLDEYVIQIELPPKNKRKLGRVRKQLSRSTMKRLKRDGRLAPKHAAALRGLWK